MKGSWVFRVVVFALFIVSCLPKNQTASDEQRRVAGAAVESCRGPSATMDYREVCGPGKDGSRVCKCLSRLVMGTDHLGNKWEQHGMPQGPGNTHWQVKKDHAKDMMDRALRAGITMFDTAPIYSEGVENTLGEWIKQKRSIDPAFKIFVLTKGGFPYDVGPGTYSSRLRGSKKEIVTHISDQVRWSRTNLDGQIDIYLMHRDDMEYKDYKNVTPDDQTPVRDILGALSDDTVYPDIENLGGKSLRDHYTWVGVSNWRTERVDAALVAARQEPRLVTPMINSPYFSLFEMAKDVTIHSGGVQVTHNEMMNPDFQKGIVLMPYSPLGGFPILDKGTPAQLGRDAWSNSKALAQHLEENSDRYWGRVRAALFTDDNEKRFERAWAISQRMLLKNKTYTIDQWLNAYVLAHPRTDLLAIGPLYPDQLERTVGSLELARVLRARPDILKWLHHGDLGDLAKIPPLAEL